MSDTPRTISEILALFADNTSGNISPQDLRDFVVSVMPQGDTVKLTDDGGVAVKLTNKTGANSVKGTAVAASTTTANAVELPGVTAYDIIGFMYEDGVADSSECWVVTTGIVEALVEDSTAVSLGDLMIAGDTTSGRVEAEATIPPPTTAEHFREVGHALTSTTAGTDNTILMTIHFN